MDLSWNVQFAKRWEGFRSKPYECPAGKLTIGYGRNIEDVGITEAEAAQLLSNDITRAYESVRALFPDLAEREPVRFAVLVDMCFNMGLPTLQTFKRMLHYVSQGHWQLAAREMESSRWSKQVKGRADRLIWIMRHGQHPA